MKLLTIAYLLVMCWGMGYSLLRLLKLELSDNLPENLVMSFGIGLGIFSALALVLNIIHVPLHWLIFFAISMVIPIWDLIKKRYNKRKELFNVKLTKGNLIFMIVLILFAVHLFVFVKGAFIYPYLEDGDPWWHASSIKYVAVHKTYSMPYEIAGGEAPIHMFKYGEPYPPFYDVTLGVIHQIEPDLNWLIKFFNALFVSLGILFIYFFLKKVSGSIRTGLAGAFLLAMIPSYLSHFIFSTTLAVTLFFVGFYSYARVGENKRWWIVAALITASIFVMQPIASFWFALSIGVYWIITLIQKQKEHKQIFLGMIGGLLISQLFWVYAYFKFGLDFISEKLSMKMFTPGVGDSSLGRIYSIADYAISPMGNMIDQPIGFGIFIFVLLIIALVIYLTRIKAVAKTASNRWILLSLILGFAAFVATESNLFSYKFTPHRQWVYLSIFVVILCAYCLNVLMSSLKDKRMRYALAAIFVLGIIFTSGYPKYVVQTSVWPQTEFANIQEAVDASWIMNNLPIGTPVFQFCTISEAQDAQVIVYNMEGYPWDLEIYSFRHEIFNKTPDEIHSFLKRKRFDYVLYGLTCIYYRKTPEEQKEVELMLQQLTSSNKFSMIHNTNTMWLFKVN